MGIGMKVGKGVKVRMGMDGGEDGMEMEMKVWKGIEGGEGD